MGPPAKITYHSAPDQVRPAPEQIAGSSEHDHSVFHLSNMAFETVAEAASSASAGSAGTGAIVGASAPATPDLPITADRPARDRGVVRGIRSRSPVGLASAEKLQRTEGTNMDTSISVEIGPTQIDLTGAAETQIPNGQQNPSQSSETQDYRAGQPLFEFGASDSSKPIAAPPLYAGERGRSPALPPGGAGSSGGLPSGEVPLVVAEPVDFSKLVTESLTTSVMPLLAEQNTLMTKQLADNSKAMLASCHTTCVAACTAANTEIVQRITGLEGSITSVREDYTNMNQKIDDLTKKLDKALSSLSHSNSLPNLQHAAQQSLAQPAPPSTASVTDSGFHRTPDPTVLYINVHDRAKVPLKLFHDSIEKLAAEAGLDSSTFMVRGDILDNRFELRFAGLRCSATSACLQFYQSLSLGRGKYKDTNALDEKGDIHKYYVNPDKNSAQVRREILCKELKDLVAPALTGNNNFVMVQKSTGSIMVNRRVLATIVILDPIKARIHWMPAIRIKYGIQGEVQANIERLFGQLVGEEP